MASKHTVRTFAKIRLSLRNNLLRTLSRARDQTLSAERKDELHSAIVDIETADVYLLRAFRKIRGF